MTEIESQSVCGYHGSSLFYMVTENLAQNGMQDMGGRVISLYGHPFFVIDGQLNRLACCYLSRQYPPLVNYQACGVFYRICYFDFEFRSADATGVPDLATGFSVKGCRLSNNFNLITPSGFLDFLAIPHQQYYLGGQFGLAVADEFGDGSPRGQFLERIADL